MYNVDENSYIIGIKEAQNSVFKILETNIDKMGWQLRMGITDNNY